MKARKSLWASLAFAMLGCGPLLRAEDPLSFPTEPAPPAGALQIAGAPIPQAPGAQTHRDLGRQALDWDRRRLLPPMQAAVKGKPWEADALKFVEDSFVLCADPDEEIGSETWAQMATRADNLLKSGCDEPTVRYFAARDKFMAKGDKNAAETEYRRLLDQLKSDVRYPKALGWQVGMNVRSILPPGPRALDAVIIDLERKSFAEGSYDGADDVLFVDQIIGATDLLSSNSDRMEKLLNGLPKLPEWARETILGRIEINRGWEFLGAGLPTALPEEKWRGFSESLNKARAHLEAAWKLRPDQPYAACEMIAVTMGYESPPSKTLRLWFDRAVTARFDFRTAYRHYTRGIRPFWGGSHEEMLAFGRACAATRRYDTQAPHHLLRVLAQIGEELPTRREVYEAPGVGDVVVAMDKGYAAEPSPADGKSLRLSNLVFDAWLSGKWEDARAALDQLPGQRLDPELHARLVEFGAGRSEVIAETLINSGPAREDYLQARDLDKRGRYDEAAPHYAAVLKACSDQPAPRELVTLYTKINDTRIELENGQWMDISPKTADTSDWDLSRQSKCPEDGVLEIIGTGEGTLSRWRRPVGENFEVRATFEFLSPLEKKHLFGIALGDRPGNPSQPVICEFYSDPKTKGKVHVLRGFGDAKNPIFDTELAMKNRLLIQCWQGRLNLYLNGKPVFERFRSTEGSPSDHNGEIGFGGYKLPAEASFRVTKIAVRVLKSPPSPPAAGEEQ